MGEAIGEEDLPSKDLNEEEVQERGCYTQIFTKMKDERKKMAINSFISLDLMRISFGIKIKQGKMKRGRGEDCWKKKEGAIRRRKDRRTIQNCYSASGKDSAWVRLVAEIGELNSVAKEKTGEAAAAAVFCRPSPYVECSHRWSASPLSEKIRGIWSRGSGCRI
ncbi:hypothetical protein MRB53_030758 [Persea americana]|uniref:Uncharacterized protein n=1 Tax=Persea americana TaxID=3435 RepID=A0ACC2KMP3_PERAE|nr:hypothetical protein MRB53_030758 [Persea americana]